MLICFLISLQLINTTNLEIVVEEFHKLDSQEAESIFINNYKDEDDPSIQAYVIAIKMKQIEYISNPMNKWKLFKANKKQLNYLIENHQYNIHLHYIRLMLQENAPSILGYKNHIGNDKKILLQLMDNDKNKYLLPYILKNTSL